MDREALVGVIASVCDELDVPYFACRGYVSQSEQWRAYRRHEGQQPTVVLHLGDHDPSGIDMTRDNQERLSMFLNDPHADHTYVRRIALNMDQVSRYNPPPNFAKQTDPRSRDYRARFGDDSWELDALEPVVLVDLIQNCVDEYRDMELWQERLNRLADDKEQLGALIETLE